MENLWVGSYHQGVLDAVNVDAHVHTASRR